MAEARGVVRPGGVLGIIGYAEAALRLLVFCLNFAKVKDSRDCLTFSALRDPW
jgi:hypothetical protein